MKLAFMIIDDSELDCYIAKKLIEHTGKSRNIQTFTAAEDALNDISAMESDNGVEKTVILLDILMPVMNGFVFLDTFEKLPEETTKQYLIVAITSSLNKNDIERVASYKSVKGVIDKPLSIVALSSIFTNCGIDWTKE